MKTRKEIIKMYAIECGFVMLGEKTFKIVDARMKVQFKSNDIEEVANFLRGKEKGYLYLVNDEQIIPAKNVESCKETMGKIFGKRKDNKIELIEL